MAYVYCFCKYSNFILSCNDDCGSVSKLKIIKLVQQSLLLVPRQVTPALLLPQQVILLASLLSVRH